MFLSCLNFLEEVLFCGTLQSAYFDPGFNKHTKLFLQSSRDADEAGSSRVQTHHAVFAELTETTAVAATGHACNGCPMLKRLVSRRGGRTGTLDVSNSLFFFKAPCPRFS